MESFTHEDDMNLRNNPLILELPLWVPLLFMKISLWQVLLVHFFQFFHLAHFWCLFHSCLISELLIQGHFFRIKKSAQVAAVYEQAVKNWLIEIA